MKEGCKRGVWEVYGGVRGVKWVVRVVFMGYKRG